MRHDGRRFFSLRDRDQKTLAWILGLGMLCMSVDVHRRDRVSPVVPSNQVPSFRFTVDLNKADAVELRQLPGIGARLAGEIVRHRETHGAFDTPESIVQVKGIGPKKQAVIAPFLSDSPIVPVPQSK